MFSNFCSTVLRVHGEKLHRVRFYDRLERDYIIYVYIDVNLDHRRRKRGGGGGAEMCGGGSMRPPPSPIPRPKTPYLYHCKMSGTKSLIFNACPFDLFPDSIKMDSRSNFFKENNSRDI